MKAFFITDYIVFFSYFICVIGIGLWVARRPKGKEINTEDFFLAGRALPWWIIGFSVIAANISTEQLIGMNGTAFESGIAVISFQWIGAAVPILIISKYFIPVFLKMKIYSLPEFLEKRYDTRVSTTMSFYWVLVFVFVNLTSVLSLGAITMETVLGIPQVYGVIILICLSAIYTVYGGLESVAKTDIIQVSVLVLGGIAVTWLGFRAISEGNSVLDGFFKLKSSMPDFFHTVLPASHEEIPWTGVFFGGIWIGAFGYWGCNQFIIQRALAAKNVKHAQNGLLLSSLLALIVSIIIVFPGIIARYLYPDMIVLRDQAFPVLIRELLPVGITGLVIAGLMAAIVSTLNSMTNSTATIFTMDIYKKFSKNTPSEKRLVNVGRIVSAAALITAALIAPALSSLGRIFAFIQEYSGYIFPGVLSIFLFGFFWKKTSVLAALLAAILTIPVSLSIKLFLPQVQYLDGRTITFLFLCLMMFLVSSFSKKEIKSEFANIGSEVSFKTTKTLNFFALLLTAITVALYIYFW